MKTDLQDLIESKSFNQLTPQEREWVLDQISEQEYDFRRKVMQTAESLGEEDDLVLMPAPRIKAALNEKLQPSPLKRTAIIPIPLYRVAAVLVVAIGVTSVLKSPEVVEVDRIVYQPQIETRVDTVVQRVVDTVRVVEKVYVDRIVMADAPIPESADRLLEPIAVVSSEQEAVAMVDNEFEMSEEDKAEQFNKSLGNSSYDQEKLEDLRITF